MAKSARPGYKPALVLAPQLGRRAEGTRLKMVTGDADQTPQGNDGVARQGAPAARSTAEARLERAPPLAALTAIFAVLHLALQRVILPLWLGHMDSLPRWMAGAARLSLNVTAAAALVCFAWGLWEMTRERGYTHGSRRLLIAILGLMVVALGAAALLLREGRVDVRAVILGAATTHALTVQLSMAALRSHPSLSGRTTAGLLAAASVFPLSSMLLRHLAAAGSSYVTPEGIFALHGLGELCFLGVPIAGAFSVIPWNETKEGARARAVGALAAFFMGLLFTAAAQLPREQYGYLLYGTLRLEFALERASLGYAVPVSLAVGAASAALLSRDARHRQGGLALWLWLSAGYNPLSPARLLLWSLSAVLLSRALISLRREHAEPAAAEVV